MFEPSTTYSASDFQLPHEFKPRVAWPEAAGALMSILLALGVASLAVTGADGSGSDGLGMALFLGATGIALALVAGWYFTSQVGLPRVPAQAEPWLPGVQVAQVKAVEVQRGDQPLVRLERREQG